MRKITVLTMISLDGVMQAPGGPREDESGDFRYGGWTADFGDEDFMEVVKKELQPAEYLLGRRTFDIFESYWPAHSAYWPGINDGMKYVLSETRDNSDWNNTRFLKDLSDIEKLKYSEGKDLQVWGSSALVHGLLKSDLVDELRIKTYPVLLGKGKRLFADNAMPAAFTLTESQVTSKGVVIASYKRSGDVVTGDVAL